jgi:hypothetical protein
MRFQDRVKELSLLDLLQKEEEAARHVLWNVQSRVLCGSRKANDPATSPQELLDRARDNLASCDVVGLSGRMNDTLELLADRVGWSGLGPLLWENVTPNRLKRQDIDPRALAILQEWNALDEQLYRHAEEIFASRHGSRSRAAVADVPSAGSFTFEKPIHGYGWHLREQGKNGWFAWTCGNEESWIDLGFAGQGDHVLQVQVDHVLDRSVVRGLEVRLNGHPLQVRRHDVGDGAILDAAVPAALLAGQARVRVGLRTFGSLRPCDLNPASEDTRSMGVAVSCIRLLPAISAASGGRLRRAG